MISDERLGEIVDFAESFGRHAKLDECASMAKELLAYRKAFSEPVAWVHGRTGIPLVDPSVREQLNLCPSSIALYRKPTIPE